MIGIGYPSSPSQGYVVTMVGNGDGNFSATGINTFTSLAESEYGATSGLAVADFNADGWPDLVVAEYGTLLGVLINNQNGTFTRLKPFHVGSVSAVTVGDFNHDGKTDLAFTYYLVMNIGYTFG